MSDQENYENLVRMLLPEGVLDYFQITNIIFDGQAYNVHLEEKNLPPQEYQKEKLLSNGFHPVRTVQDFPIRGKGLFLHLKRRRWLVESTGKTISRDWNTVAAGARYTKEFASFLKDAFGFPSD